MRRLMEGEPFTLFCWLLLLGLSANGEFCGPSMDISRSNYISEFQRLEKCTVVEGYLQIQFINTNQELLRSLSFPKLTVITDYLMLFQLSGLVSLSTLFPNLSVIHGRNLILNHALVIMEMPDLKDVGLYSLKNITRGDVIIGDNPKLCYVDTVDWSLITDTGFNSYISGNKQQCSDVCPGVVENRPQCGRTMFNHNYNYRCWSSSHCQTVWAKVELTMNGTVDTVEVYKDDTVQIPCHYNLTDNGKPSLFMIQWMVKSTNSSQRIFHGNNDQQMVERNTEYSERIQVTVDKQGSVLTLRDVRLSDERLFVCQVNGLGSGSAEGRTHLRVFAPPQPPVIEGVLTGISVTNETLSKVASCEARGFPKPNITWYRNQLPLVPAQGHVNMVTQEPEGFFTVQSELQYKVVKEDQDARFTCEVSYLVPGAVRTAKSRDINITVHYPATMVELLKESPPGLVKEGDTVELRCHGDANPPAPFIFNREQEPEVDLGSSGDVLVLSRVTRRDSGVYQCRPPGNQSRASVMGDMRLTVHYLDPVVMKPRHSKVMFKGQSLTATCNAQSSLKTTAVWYKKGKQVGRGHTLTLEDATSATAGKYLCEVTVPGLPALHSTGSVHIKVEDTLRAPSPRRSFDSNLVHINRAGARPVMRSEDQPSAPRNLKAEAVSSSAIRLSWDHPLINSDKVYSFYIYMKKEGLKYLDNLPELLVVDNATTRQLIEPLQPAQSYNFYIVAYTRKGGAGPQSDHVVQKTLEDVPLRAPGPSNIQVSEELYGPPPDIPQWHRADRHPAGAPQGEEPAPAGSSGPTPSARTSQRTPEASSAKGWSGSVLQLSEVQP